MTDEQPPPVRRPGPLRRIGRRAEPAAPMPAPNRAAEAQTPDPLAHVTVYSRTDDDPIEAKRGERIVAALFLLSAIGSLGFCAIWFFTSVSGANLAHLRRVNFLMGAALGAALCGTGAAFIVWAKRLMPHVKYVQEREPMHSTPEDELAAEKVVLDGATSMGIARRPLVLRSAGLALGVLGLPAIVALRDMGPALKDTLRTTAWTAGDRMVDINTGRPIMLGDLEMGGYVTVMPEGSTDTNANALTPTLLIRLRPGENRPLPGRESWAAADHVAYSKICTHAGCPIGLYEEQTHHMLCPCHQSTFLATEGAKVIFGPAARSLPQLPIMLDAAGYFRAQSPFHEPCGPSFWERG
ncbi:MAG TPA: Rieske 2Fe-2S domain-containing protein [Mycobacteriales bacterium]|nr:Rieske 2Fe-2S domain-containing protein [Mycobacteriales bacterium]